MFSKICYSWIKYRLHSSLVLWQSFTYWSLLPWQVHLVSNTFLVQQSKGVHRDVCCLLVTDFSSIGERSGPWSWRTISSFPHHGVSSVNESEFPVSDSVLHYSFGLWKVQELLGCAAEAQRAKYTSSLSVALFCKHRTDPHTACVRAEGATLKWYVTSHCQNTYFPELGFTSKRI